MLHHYDISHGIQKLKSKTTLVLTGGAFAAVLALGGGAAQAAGPVCTVPSTTYATIQAAVNDNACTTINVASGAYAESVNIPRAVTLNGPNAGNSGAGSRGAEAIVNDINITASNVIVNGFSFSNPGIQMNINGTTSAILSGVAVKNNIFSGYSSVGLPTYNAGNLLITKNLFRNPLPSTEAMQIKADSSTLDGCNGTVVSNNVFTAASNNGGADINFTCTGSNSTGVTVSGNTDTGLSDTNGTSFTAFSGVVGSIVVTNNHVTGTPKSGSAVFFFGTVTGSVLIDSNQITGGGGSAVSIHGADITSDTANSGTFTITNNNLSGNARGIYVASTALTSGAQVIANRNNVSANSTYGIDNETSTTIVANGSCNWWGAANGPGTVGTGSGAMVSAKVTFTPWLVSSNLNGSCIGLPHPTDKADCKDGGWKQFSNPSFKNQGQCIDWVQATASGNLKMSGPSQAIKFEVANNNDRSHDRDKNTVEYWNYDYPGVLHYTAAVTCTYVNPQTNEARFMFQIPAGHGSLSGLYVVAYVKEVNQKHMPDLYGHEATADLATATQWCQTGTGFAPTMYPVTKGNVEIN